MGGFLTVPCLHAFVGSLCTIPWLNKLKTISKATRLVMLS
jgi:hypothetical protein